MGHTRICERDKWTSHGMSYGPMGSWDGMDSRTHMHLQEGQVDIPWNVPWSMGSCDEMDSGTHTHLREGQVDILSHGPMGSCDGMDCGTHIYL